MVLSLPSYFSEAQEPITPGIILPYLPLPPSRVQGVLESCLPLRALEGEKPHVGSAQQTPRKKKRHEQQLLFAPSPPRGDTHTSPLSPSPSPPFIAMMPLWSFRAVRSPLRNFGGTGAAGLGGGSPMIKKCSSRRRGYWQIFPRRGEARPQQCTQHQITYARTQCQPTQLQFLTFNMGDSKAEPEVPLNGSANSQQLGEKKSARTTWHDLNLRKRGRPLLPYILLAPPFRKKCDRVKNKTPPTKPPVEEGRALVWRDVWPVASYVARADFSSDAVEYSCRSARSP